MIGCPLPQYRASVETGVDGYTRTLCRIALLSASPLRYKQDMTGADDLDTRLRAAMFAHLNRVSSAHPDGAPPNVINSSG
jgi:hypothetical protein